MGNTPTQRCHHAIKFDHFTGLPGQLTELLSHDTHASSGLDTTKAAGLMNANDEELPLAGRLPLMVRPMIWLPWTTQVGMRWPLGRSSAAQD